MHNLIIFASGRGSNARSIWNYFNAKQGVHIALVVANKEGLEVLDWARSLNIPTLVAGGGEMASGEFVAQLKSYKPGLIVLAGFIRRVPAGVITAFPNKIINIHPALLPHFGGKGMWGVHVHMAVLAAGGGESGITIHRVTERYDEGAVLLQARCPVLPADGPADLAARVLKLEHRYYPQVIEWLLEEPYL